MRQILERLARAFVLAAFLGSMPSAAVADPAEKPLAVVPPIRPLKLTPDGCLGSFNGTSFVFPYAYLVGPGPCSDDKLVFLGVVGKDLQPATSHQRGMLVWRLTVRPTYYPLYGSWNDAKPKTRGEAQMLSTRWIHDKVTIERVERDRYQPRGEVRKSQDFSLYKYVVPGADHTYLGSMTVYMDTDNPAEIPTTLILCEENTCDHWFTFDDVVIVKALYLKSQLPMWHELETGVRKLLTEFKTLGAKHERATDTAEPAEAE